MRQIEIIQSFNPNEVEQKVNSFCAREDIYVRDIKFRTEVSHHVITDELFYIFVVVYDVED